MYRLEAIDFGRRMAVDKEIEKTDTAPQPNAIFDESSNFLIYATLLGIKVKILLLTQIRNVIFFFVHCILFTCCKHDYFCVCTPDMLFLTPPFFYMLF